MHARITLVATSLLLVLFFVPFFTFAALTPEERALLETQLAQIEAEINANKSELTKKQQERQTLERDVSILDAKIKDAQLAIKQRELSIRKIGDGVADKEAAIIVLDGKVLKGQESIAQMLRRTHEIDEITPVELALGGNISDLFTEVDAFQSVQVALDQAFQAMAVLRDDLSDRKTALLEQQSEEEELKQIQVYQRRSLQETEEEKKTLVSTVKGQENQYQKVIATQTKTASEIRARLFELRDSGAIPFGKAYEYAKEASATTGVRPAVILGILAQESNLGENVGTGNWKTDMHPTRDRPIFEQLMSELGFNPDEMKVSKKPWYGWGGAMGPTQFIPSTWVLYKERIASASGQSPPNPWDARTAVFATGLLMMDNGAADGTRAAERKAALRYFAGGNWSKPAYAFYGDGVMGLADKFQSEIDVLEGR
ncbi:MAG: lytic murein transglycosylase [Minisyncoccia bacterium]